VDEPWRREHVSRIVSHITPDKPKVPDTKPGKRRRGRAVRHVQAAPPSEDAIERELLAEGVIDQAPPLDIAARHAQIWKPIKVRGRPASEILIEERR
jgi:hypothetical protein